MLKLFMKTSDTDRKNQKGKGLARGRKRKRRKRNKRLLFGRARLQFAERGSDVVFLKIIAGGCVNFVEIGMCFDQGNSN